MNKTTIVMALAIGATLQMTGRALAADTPKSAAPTEATAATQPAKGPRIAIEPASFDFGKTVQNKTLSKEFTIRNLGTEDLVIDQITTSCGCTAAVPGEKTIKPGGTTPLHVELQTRTMIGKMERQVMVRSNDPTNHNLQLVKVQADVSPDTPAPAAK